MRPIESDLCVRSLVTDTRAQWTQAASNGGPRRHLMEKGPASVKDDLNVVWRDG